MPARKQTQLKASTQKHIVMLYEKPIFKFLKAGEVWEDLADLIYGPLETNFKRLAELEQLWGEVREDILRAQQEYQPNRKPWGTRFD
jgi:hypothetical protein